LSNRFTGNLGRAEREERSEVFVIEGVWVAIVTKACAISICASSTVQERSEAVFVRIWALPKAVTVATLAHSMNREACSLKQFTHFERQVGSNEELGANRV